MHRRNVVHKPQELVGVRVLVGRTKSQAHELSRLLQQRGATVIEIPFIEIRPPQSWNDLDRALRNLNSYHWLILTSVNGVKTLFSRMERLGVGTTKLKKIQVAAIGPATKAALERQNVEVALTPREYIAEAVVEALRARVVGKRVLLVRAQEARDVIPRELSQAGAEVDVVAAYETVLPAGSRSQLERILRDPRQRPHVIAFTSSSTVRNFRRLASGLVLDSIRFASIGPVTSNTMKEMSLTVHAQAREYTAEGLAKAIAELGS
ncbi:MAG: uroporphyrinogen-III synthase [Acidobacteriales bacterium]|nr:uroporphyrinogen-III synthase [Terriglobales bacterium]